jgi:2-dehydro-3-deoxy-D-gluconate 5-dehydrogenase
VGIVDRFRLDGKTALVTGAASGLGAAIALALADAGAAVACHGNRRPAEETARQIREWGTRRRSFSADLSAEDGAERLFSDVVVAMGAPDILVNNAGTIHREAAEDHELEAWKQVLQVNLTSAFRLCQLAGREMLKRRRERSLTSPP